ncbi:hypothetical protein Noda2021_06400 [Candidatus Dependentiae bacterium Noda2021]|nr:hypothetical protein Noda2021_06400 [Candidatus Dependentiae bacterium Noda2021]
MLKKIMMLCFATMPLIGMEKNTDTTQILSKNFDQIPLNLGTIINNTGQDLIMVSSLGQRIIDLPAGKKINVNTIIEPLITPNSIRATQNFIVFILPADQKDIVINHLKNAKNDNEKQNGLLTYASVYKSINPYKAAYLHYQLSKERKDMAVTVALNTTKDFTYGIKPEFVKIKRIVPSTTNTQLRPYVINLTLKNLSNGSISPESIIQLTPEISNLKLYKTIQMRDFNAVKQQIRGLNLNMIDERGNNPLHHAVKNSSPEIITLLLQAAPQLAALKNYQGQTPVDLAVGNFDILQLFVVPRTSTQCPQ